MLQTPFIGRWGTFRDQGRTSDKIASGTCHLNCDFAIVESEGHKKVFRLWLLWKVWGSNGRRKRTKFDLGSVLRPLKNSRAQLAYTPHLSPFQVIHSHNVLTVLRMLAFLCQTALSVSVGALTLNKVNDYDFVFRLWTWTLPVEQQAKLHWLRGRKWSENFLFTTTATFFTHPLVRNSFSQRQQITRNNRFDFHLFLIRRWWAKPKKNFFKSKFFLGIPLEKIGWRCNTRVQTNKILEATFLYIDNDGATEAG